MSEQLNFEQMIEESMKNIIFLAPPAGGKGTQSELLCNKYGYVQLSTGDLLREEVKKGNEDLNNIMKSGALVSDDIIINLISQKISKIENNFILDGFPRDIDQAEALTEICSNIGKSINYVIAFNIDKDLAKKRIIGRLTCPKCNRIYNSLIEESNPKNKNLCDDCNIELFKRIDDNEESFEKRYNTYLKLTMPLIEYYKKRGILFEIDSSKSKNEIFKQIEEIING